MPIEIRRIRSDEWQLLRELRLRALADAPTAYGSTLAAEAAYPDDTWRERAEGASAGCDRATFVAELDGRWIGSVTGLGNRFAGPAGVPQLVAMFVAPDARRQGVGIALVAAIAGWARECGTRELGLWVTAGNDAAIALYRRCGFDLTGNTRPHTHTPALAELEMVRGLAKPGQ